MPGVLPHFISGFSKNFLWCWTQSTECIGLKCRLSEVFLSHHTALFLSIALAVFQKPVVLFNLAVLVSLAKYRSSSRVRILVCITSTWNASWHTDTCWTVGLTQTCRHDGFGRVSAPGVPRSQWENNCIDWSLVSRQTRKQHKFTGTVSREMEGLLAPGGDCGNGSTLLWKESLGMVEGKSSVVTDGSFSRFRQ